jgi:hypothetical protein
LHSASDWLAPHVRHCSDVAVTLAVVCRDSSMVDLLSTHPCLHLHGRRYPTRPLVDVRRCRRRCVTCIASALSMLFSSPSLAHSIPTQQTLGFIYQRTLSLRRNTLFIVLASGASRRRCGVRGRVLLRCTIHIPRGALDVALFACFLTSTAVDANLLRVTARSLLSPPPPVTVRQLFVNPL